MSANRSACGVLAGLVACVIAGCGAGNDGAGTADRGAVVYATHCAACHQRDGRGVGSTQPPLAGSATVAGDRDALIAWVAFGRRPATLPTRKSLSVMPQFAWLSDDDLAAVLTHVRSHFGNDATAISAADVAAVRAAGGS